MLVNLNGAYDRIGQTELQNPYRYTTLQRINCKTEAIVKTVGLPNKGIPIFT
jgi:hypothetical protein